MKRSKNGLLVSFSVVLAVVVLTPFLVIGYQYFTRDEFDEKYGVEYISDDGRIHFILNNRMGWDGRGRYDGSYFNEEGNAISIDLYIDGEKTWAISKDRTEYIFGGTGKIEGYLEKNYTVTVEKWDDMGAFVYDQGTQIIFSKQK